MPFNSTQNNFNSKYEPEETFRELQNSYTISKEGFDHIPHPNMIYREKNAKQQFILPANVHSSVSYYDQDELKYINTDRRSGSGMKTHFKQDNELVGEGIGKLIKKAANKTSHAIKEGAYATDRATKGTRRALKKSTVDENGAIHQIISKTADLAIPMAATSAGLAIGTATGNPTVGLMAGKIAGDVSRKQLKQHTGYGVPGVGEYKNNVSLDKLLTKYAPNYKEEVKTTNKKVTVVKPKKTNNKVNQRNILVKKIMTEKKLNLPQASKYVKDNNLY